MSEKLTEKARVAEQLSEENPYRLRRFGRNVLGAVGGFAVFGVITYGGYKAGENIFAPLSPDNSEASSIMGGLFIGTMMGGAFGLTTWAVISGDPPSTHTRPRRTEQPTPPPDASGPAIAAALPPELQVAKVQLSQEIQPQTEQIQPAANTEPAA